MLRTLVLAAAASVALAGAALSPTAASAHGYRGWHHHSGWNHHRHWGGPRGFYRPAYAAYNPCIRKRWVPTPWGPRLRVVNVCY